MDANGLRFWLLSQTQQWALLGEPSGLEYDSDQGYLQLASQRRLPAQIDRDSARTTSERDLGIIPQTLDSFGMRAFWEASTRRVMAVGALPTPIACLPPADGAMDVASRAQLTDLFNQQDPTDIVMGYDGILYVAIAHHIILYDVRGTWQPIFLSDPTIRPWRLAAAADGGCWVLGDRDHHPPQLGRIQGIPWPDVAADWEYTPGTFRPRPENATPPRLSSVSLDQIWNDEAGGGWPADQVPVAIAINPAGQVALLTWSPEGQGSVFLVTPEHTLLPIRYELQGAIYPYSLGWVSAHQLAVLVAYPIEGAQEALVYRLPAGVEGRSRQAEVVSLMPVGHCYPLSNQQPGPFVHSLQMPVHYPTVEASRPLHPIRLSVFATQGEGISRFYGQTPNSPSRPVAHSLETDHTTVDCWPIDSGSAQTVWHRLYIEAAIPAHCGIRLFLAATDTPTLPPWPPASPTTDEAAASEWFEHRFGEAFATVKADEVPQGAWLSEASELPFHPGLLHCSPEPQRVGLFTVLIQRSQRQVRTLRGRYLWLRVVMTGDGRSTPKLAAVRVYASRFSYLNEYLPELYREDLFGPDADEIGPSTGADFLERFLNLFEGVLTPLEDKIAQAHLLTDPCTTVEAALDWLGSWVGVTFDTAYQPAQKRHWLAAIPQLYRYRGTLRGLQMALEIATGGRVEAGQMSGGAVSGGEIIVVENFRLRRTFATILGADLADEQDPLLQGLVTSGNSYVGDTLMLGDDTQREFLALFGPEIVTTPAEVAAVASFYEMFAQRVTILVHQDVEPQDLGLIRRVAQLETPAHVETQVVAVSRPLMVAVASLVGVDTYLGVKPQGQPIRVGHSQIGVRDRLQRPASLDPRLDV